MPTLPGHPGIAQATGATESTHLRQLRLVSELAVRLSATPSVEVIQHALERITEAFDAHTGAAYLRTGDVLSLVAHVGISPAAVERLRILHKSRGPAGLAAERRLPVRVNTPEENDPSARWFADSEGTRCAAAVPLMSKDDAVGSLGLSRKVDRPFTDFELELLAGLGAQLGIAIELTRAQEQLVRRERLAAIGELAAIVAHEIRNPLGAIYNAVSALKSLLPQSGDPGALLRILEEESERVNLIIGDLLDFASPRTPSLHAEDLAPILEGAVAAALSRATGPVQLVVELDPALPQVLADARHLRQAFLNVALNAVQAMSAGGVLHVRAERNAGWVRVSFEDSGSGISEANLTRIFEPFFTTRATGSGLGLPLVKRILDEHRGTISVNSKVGEGTTFVLQVPVAR